MVPCGRRVLWTCAERLGDQKCSFYDGFDVGVEDFGVDGYILKPGMVIVGVLMGCAWIVEKLT